MGREGYKMMPDTDNLVDNSVNMCCWGKRVDIQNDTNRRNKRCGWRLKRKEKI